MKNSILITVIAMASFGVAADAQAASSMFTVTHYPQASVQGWPEWIGRLEDIAYVRYERPEMGPQYLPLSLIRTGAYDTLIKEIMGTPNVDSTKLPEWIGN